jgi:hypothetical protein
VDLAKLYESCEKRRLIFELNLYAGVKGEIMSRVDNTGWDRQYLSQIKQSTARTSEEANIAQEVGQNLTNAEKKLFDVFRSGEGTYEGMSKESAIAMYKMKYDRQMRIFEAFQKLMDASHQIMMRIIGRISARY